MSTVLSQDKELAINGGPATREASLHSWPDFSEDEIDTVTAVLRSGKVNYWVGEECQLFEEEFAAFHGVRHAVSLANGTLALELALRVLGIGPGDDVLVTARSFFASASCISLSGAKPVFVDVDRNSQNVTASTLAEKITARTRAIIVVHLAGWPCEMPEIMNLANQHGLKVIEDCAQAHGAKIGGKLVGTFGDCAAYSFCQDKIMSTGGEGGMLITNDARLWKAAWEFKDHGKSWDRVNANDHPVGFRWLHEGIGSNWRLTEMQSAIGRIQLRKLEGWIQSRQYNARRLMDGIEDLPLLRIPKPEQDLSHAYYKLYVFIGPELLQSGWSRELLLEALTAEGIPGLSGSCPEIYREGAYATHGYDVLPVARELGETSIMFMVHPTLDRDDIDDVIAATRKVCTAATR